MRRGVRGGGTEICPALLGGVRRTRPLARGPLVGAAWFATWSIAAEGGVSMRRGVRGGGTVNDTERRISWRRDASGLGS